MPAKESDSPTPTPTPAPAAARTRLLAVAFAVSGFASLSYEVLWTRQLGLVFGSTIYAVSVMLAVFMLGLTIGAVVGGRVADRVRSQWFAFGVVEVAIGVFGYGSGLAITASSAMYLSIVGALSVPAWTLSAFQFMVALVAMIVPTALIGSTFPLVTRADLVSTNGIGSHVGRLYAANTAGSVLGAITTGFVLVPTVGVRESTMIVATLNIAVGVVVLVVYALSSRREETNVAATIESPEMV